MSFSSWLHKPMPEWKKNLEVCNDNVFEELKLTKEELEEILEKLDEYEIL